MKRLIIFLALTFLCGCLPSCATKSDLSALNEEKNADIAEMNEKLAGLKAQLAKAIEEGDGKVAVDLMKEINTLRSDMGQTLEDLNTALEKAVKDGDSKVVEELTGKINSLRSDMTGELSSLKTVLESAIKKGDDEVKKELAEIMDGIFSEFIASVQSITAIPTDKDNSVSVSAAPDQEIWFKIYPEETASALAGFADKFKLTFVRTKAPQIDTIAISSVTYDAASRLVDVKFDGSSMPEEVRKGFLYANATLSIRDKYCTKESPYFLLKFEAAPLRFNINSATAINPHSATLHAYLDTAIPDAAVKFYYSYKAATVSSLRTTGVAVDGTLNGTDVSADLTDLLDGRTYYFIAVVTIEGREYETAMDSFTTTKDGRYVDLSVDGTANCYIVSRADKYRFIATKGNTDESVGNNFTSVEVLWESFGTDEEIEVGALIRDISLDRNSFGDVINFTATGRKGNALIAAKDAEGTILWSWHIWMTDTPEDQVYNNNAGIMMDRNLGATSAARGDVAALGLQYEWGRKDPLLGASSVSEDVVAKSAGTDWPYPVTSDATVGTVEYATSHPMTFIYAKNWLAENNNSLWAGNKTKYDPCPVGYRVPDGGENGLWAKAFGRSTQWEDSQWAVGEYHGMDFGDMDTPLGTGTIWYPSAGYRMNLNGTFVEVGFWGYYWTSSYSPDDANSAYCFGLCPGWNGKIFPVHESRKGNAHSVRCCRE